MESGNLRLPKQLMILRVHPQRQHRPTEAREKHVLDREWHRTSNVKRLLSLSCCGWYKYPSAALHLQEAECSAHDPARNPALAGAGRASCDG